MLAFRLLLLATVLSSCGGFDPGEWRDGTPRERYDLVAPLVESGILIGISRDSVLSLLGPPDAAEASPSPSTRYMEYSPQAPSWHHLQYGVHTGEEWPDSESGMLFVDLGRDGNRVEEVYLSYPIGE